MFTASLFVNSQTYNRKLSEYLSVSKQLNSGRAYDGILLSNKNKLFIHTTWIDLKIQDKWRPRVGQVIKGLLAQGQQVA